MQSLVTTEWLAGELGANDLRVVDATYFLAEHGRNAAAEYEAAHIPGAVFMDLADIADANTSLPSMLPPPEKFASRMQSLGLGDGSRIVLYDNSPLKTAARAWWMLRHFGAHDVAILDGGLAKWQAEGREVKSGKETLRHRHFTVWADDKSVRTLDQMKANVDSGAEQVVDARSAARFTGEEPDPRPATHAGHIPGSKNLPYGELFNDDGTYKQGDALKAAFADAGIDVTKPVVTTCGSGITAAVLLFGLHLLGNSAALYDGAWSEWGADRSTPKAMGAA
ncbi:MULTISPECIES: 3-mercaptopyruvate sulfurtransferase [unclassified Sphingomonas]|jgi:thiosulfate/3-mercaptopyruvate sulfurtransferase|uniref:3-mercaptopyruvate sulfurtransferase n=1 Tax=unclassified Sphingomonas TaxID=196159 RepID=UPI000830FBA2|nr:MULTISPECIES: 3-mercaptopyruvate sulfurtransferase [unclassified Sphingomonas]MCH4893824.1 3-mercaptopyruvate sulfurtransferase [Sphingomonas sp. SFZ2018-12]